MSDEDRKQVLGEALMDELKALREGFDVMATRAQVRELDNAVAGLQRDMQTVLTILKDLSTHTRQHKQVLDGFGKRLGSLEQRLTVLEEPA